jgi:preprotein translocase subunit SecF
VISGLAVFFLRDEAKTGSKYDIEFIGGTSVEIELKQGAGFDRAAVEQKINQWLGNARVYEVGNTGQKFEISTTLTNKTTATISFGSPAGQTVQSVTSMIQAAADKAGKPLSNLTVTDKGSGTFEISTSRVNANLVEEVLTNAVGEAGTVSQVEVHEIVSDAVREAFHDYLSVRENLGLAFTAEEKIEIIQHYAS